MKIEKKFFHSKLARRIFLMFVACALLPIAGLFILSFNQVTAQLNAQSHKRLKQSVKFYGLSVYERLLFLEAEMQLLASSLHRMNARPIHTLPVSELSNQLSDHFKGLQLFDAKNDSIRLFGHLKNPPNPNSEEIQHMRAGKTAIKVWHDADLPPRVLMMQLMNFKVPGSGLLVGEINPLYLWGADHDNILPPDVRVCVLDDSKDLLFSSLHHTEGLSEQIERRSETASSSIFEFLHEKERYVASSRTIFLKPNFLISNWTIVLLQSGTDVLSPMSSFKKMFLLVALMSLWVVLLLSVAYIRKSLVPLASLKEGTRRIAKKDFDSQVTVQSNDEFEELADAFNEMSSRLSRQFKTLVTKTEIDQAILSSLETEKIVATVLDRMRECFSYGAVSISLVDPETDHQAYCYMGSANPKQKISKQSIRIESRDRQKLYLNPEFFFSDVNQKIPAYLSNLAKCGSKSFVVLPIFLKERLSAVIAFGQSKQKQHSEEDLNLARQMADQVAVALANSQLIEELNRLNWGTLKALARTVDAKSSWTAGHSERVAEMAHKIGKSLNLNAKLLEDLQRAAFLHDIGKIGVPLAILDKPGALGIEEFNIIKAHPQIGARILEPIKAYDELIPMVLQHHENFDGKGYPDGLAGDAISLGARILAVADVFDALKSDRPYRKGMPLEQVIDIIRKEAGHQFDTKVVEALLAVVEWQGVQAA